MCVENVLSGDALARVQTAWAEWEAPSKATWLEARAHCSGIARHSFAASEEGWPVVSRKWFGITGLSYGANPSVNPVSKPFIELDPSFVRLRPCCRSACCLEGRPHRWLLPVPHVRWT